MSSGFEIGEVSLSCAPTQIAKVNGSNVWVCATDNVSSGSSAVSYWNNSGTNVFLANTSDKVGIGTTSPNNKLTIYDGNVAAGSTGAIIDLESADTTIRGDSNDVIGTIQFRARETEFPHSIGAKIVAKSVADNGISIQAWSASANDAPTQLQFYTQSDGVTDDMASPRMVVSSLGRVGIGTTLPTHTLTVVGDMNLTGNLVFGDGTTQSTAATGGSGGNTTQEMINAVNGTALNLENAYGYPISTSSSRQIYLDEFQYYATARTEGIGVCAALSSGTAAGVTDVYIGQVRFSDSTTAGGGFQCRSDALSMYFIGGEKFTTRIKTGAGRATNIEDIGFSDSTTAAKGTDYCAFNSTNLLISAGCRNNAGPTVTTGASYLRSANTWYTYTIEANTGATSINFTIWDAAGSTALWSKAVAANIPNTSARAFGTRIAAWESTTDAAAIIMTIDYAKLEDTTWA